MKKISDTLKSNARDSEADDFDSGAPMVPVPMEVVAKAEAAPCERRVLSQAVAADRRQDVSEVSLLSARPEKPAKLHIVMTAERIKLLHEIAIATGIQSKAGCVDWSLSAMHWLITSEKSGWLVGRYMAESSHFQELLLPKPTLQHRAFDIAKKVIRQASQRIASRSG
jgi:hypothetical protein